MINYIYTLLIISHLSIMQTNKINILDTNRNNWLVVNDNVMGGIGLSGINENNLKEDIKKIINIALWKHFGFISIWASIMSLM